MLILGAMLCCYSLTFAQTSPNGSATSYLFKVSNITGEDQVKQIQAQLEGYFDGILNYNATNNTFHITSNGIIEKTRISAALSELNYSLTFFSINGSEINLER